MGLREFMEIGGFLIVVLGFFFNMYETGRIKSNCIATLNARVDEIERKLTALFRLSDESIKRDTDMAVQLARIEQKVSDRLNGGSK